MVVVCRIRRIVVLLLLELFEMQIKYCKSVDDLEVRRIARCNSKRLTS